MKPPPPPITGPQNRQPWRQEMEMAFEQGAIEHATPEQRQKWSIILASETERFNNAELRLIRSLALNHAQTAALIKNLNDRNDKTQFWFKVLAIGSLIVGFIGSAAQVVGVWRDFVAQGP